MRISVVILLTRRVIVVIIGLVLACILCIGVICVVAVRMTARVAPLIIRVIIRWSERGLPRFRATRVVTSPATSARATILTSVRARTSTRTRHILPMADHGRVRRNVKSIYVVILASFLRTRGKICAFIGNSNIFETLNEALGFVFVAGVEAVLPVDFHLASC